MDADEESLVAAAVVVVVLGTVGVRGAWSALPWLSAASSPSVSLPAWPAPSSWPPLSSSGTHQDP